MLDIELSTSSSISLSTTLMQVQLTTTFLNDEISVNLMKSDFTELLPTDTSDL